MVVQPAALRSPIGGTNCGRASARGALLRGRYAAAGMGVEEKKWALDLWSREWVEERIITGVEVETEGERWVYDIYNENESTTGLAETPAKGMSGPQVRVSWEEGEEGMGRRGEWRRRRWVRMVKRRNMTPGA